MVLGSGWKSPGVWTVGRNRQGAQKPVKRIFVKMWMTDNEVCAKVLEGDVLNIYEAELTGLGVEEEEGR